MPHYYCLGLIFYYGRAVGAVLIRQKEQHRLGEPDAVGFANASRFDWVAEFVCVVNFKARVGADLSATPRGGLALMNLAFQLDINSWLLRIVVAKQVQRRLGESMGGRKICIQFSFSSL